MNQEGITTLFSTLGASKITLGSDNVVTNCLFAPFLHPSKAGCRSYDNRPSFSVKINNEGASAWHCFTCNAKGQSLDVFLRRLDLLRGRGQLAELIREVEAVEKEDPSSLTLNAAGHYKTVLDTKHKPALFDTEDIAWDEAVLSKYRPGVHSSFIQRGLDIATCKTFGLLFDERQNRVLFPIRRQSDKSLVGLTGRICGKGEPKYKDYWGFHKAHYLYGEHLLDLTLPSILVVEGMFDVLKLWHYGYRNIVATMGVKVTYWQIRKLFIWGLPLYLAHDWDAAGNDARQTLIHFLKGRVPLYDVPQPVGNPMPDDPGACAKDAFDLALKKSKKIL